MKKVFYRILTTDYVMRQPIPIEMWNKNFSGQGSFKSRVAKVKGIIFEVFNILDNICFGPH